MNVQNQINNYQQSKKFPKKSQELNPQPNSRGGFCPNLVVDLILEIF